MPRGNAQRNGRSVRTTTRKAGEFREPSNIQARRPVTGNAKKIGIDRRDAEGAEKSERLALGPAIVPAAPAKPPRGMKLKTVSRVTMLFALLCLGAFLAGRPPVSAARVDAAPQSKKAMHVSRAKNGHVSSTGSRRGHKLTEHFAR